MHLLEFFKITLPSYVISYLIFYFIYSKLVSEKLRNIKTYLKVIIILIGILFNSIALEIVDSFEATKVYHSLIMGILLGVFCAIIPFIVPKNNIKR